MSAVHFDQNLQQQVTRSLSFTDETGQKIQLGDYFGTKPMVLVLGYYECPMLCNLVLNGLVAALQELRMTVGEDFGILMVSIDPEEAPSLARAKKHTYLTRYGRAGAEGGWHFLTGDQPAITQLAEEVGFHFAYDPSIDQYAHPSGIIVLTPDGQVSQYLFGVNFPAKELNTALKAAAVRQVGSPVDQLILLCFHYNPLRGKYGNLIMILIRLAAALTLLAIAALLLSRGRRHGRGRAAARSAKSQASSDVASPPSRTDQGAGL